MVLKRNWKDVVKGYVWQGMAVAIIAVFAGYALFGANGVLAWGDYSQRLSAHTRFSSGTQASKSALSWLRKAAGAAVAG